MKYISELMTSLNIYIAQWYKTLQHLPNTDDATTVSEQWFSQVNTLMTSCIAFQVALSTLMSLILNF